MFSHFLLSLPIQDERKSILGAQFTVQLKEQTMLDSLQPVSNFPFLGKAREWQVAFHLQGCQKKLIFWTHFSLTSGQDLAT